MAYVQGSRSVATPPTYLSGLTRRSKPVPTVARSYQGSPPPRRDGFWTGFALGGAIFGAAGFFFAPQISRAILNEQQKFKAPNWFEEEKPPVTKQELEEKIDQLHAAINDVATQVGPPDSDFPKPANNSSQSVENVVKP